MAEQALKKAIPVQAKPILKWAGGKTQMLGDLIPKVPTSYGRYIEPFFGGGAMFFALQPENAVIADSNPELINMYRQVADHVLKADTYPAVQECYLRAMSVEQFALPDGIHYFSPLRWLLAIMLELEKRTGTSELSRIEFALWGHTTNPSYNLSEVILSQ